MQTPDYPTAEWERSMKVQEVILKAKTGKITWIQASTILGWTARRLRRWRARYDKGGPAALLDARRRTPSLKSAGLREVGRIVELYREKYAMMNARHFHETVCREHEVTLSYTKVKSVLQEAGLIHKKRGRGKHRLRRPRRECFGEMLHLDGSLHAWIACKPGEKQTMIVVVDDATSALLYAHLEPSESSLSVMRALYATFEKYGIPQALYTDRASWAAFTRKAGEPVDKTAPTKIGRALERLGVEHILAYSPQARGRGERMNRTLQDRLVSELQVAGIENVADANAYIQRTYMNRHNPRFSRKAQDAQSAFVHITKRQLDDCMRLAEDRIVAADNTVTYETMRLQLSKQPGRSSCKGLKVQVVQTLRGAIQVRWGTRLLGTFGPAGQPIKKGDSRQQPAAA
jgi:transposase